MEPNDLHAVIRVSTLQKVLLILPSIVQESKTTSISVSPCFLSESRQFEILVSLQIRIPFKDDITIRV